MKRFLLILLYFSLTATGYCTSYTATITGNWSNPATWGGSGFPGAGDSATISSAVTVTVDVASTCTNLTFSAGTITQNANLTITGTYNQSGGTFTASSPSTVSFSANDFRIPTASGTLRFNRFTGSGTSGSPYAIYDVYGLQAMEEELGDFFILANNVDASATVNWNAGSGFAPIANSGFPTFSGNFNGEGYTVSHIAINLPGTNYVGLFGFAALGTNSISNLYLTVDNITGSSYVGGLAGYFSSGTVSDVSVTVNSSKTVSGSGGYSGGLVGFESGGSISNSYVTISGTVSGASEVGGFVGGDSGSYILNSYANIAGTVTGTGSYIGGFVGENSSTSISDSYATGTVSGTGTYVGGFAGGDSSTISNSYATVSVSGSSTVNGFVGLNSSGVYNNDWYYNGTTYTQPANVTQATGYSDFYATGSGTGGAVYLVSGTCPAWNFPANWTSQAGAYPILSAFTTWDVWQGPSGGLWSNGANWSSGVPTSTTNVLFNTTDNNNSTIDASFAGTIANLSINGYTGTITQSHNFTITGAYVQTSGTFTCTTPATYTFSASEGFSIPTTSGTLYFNRFTGGGGSANPYVIYDVYGLQAMEEELGDFYILANNIDASATANWNSGSGFTPVSSSPFPAFSGNFNGEGYTISHLNIILHNTSYVGLFGYASLGSNSISNLNLTVDNIISSGSQYVGGLAGFISGGSISTVSVTVNSGKIVSGSSEIGGITGENAGTAISNTYATISGSVTGASYTGGFVGYETSGNISNSYVTIPGTVSGTGSFIGGFVGYDNSSGVTISDSYTTGTVSGTGTDVGGFVGYNSSSNISNSYATVSVTGSSNVNGFVGLDSSGVYNNDWYYNGTTYTQPANVTQATGYSDFYATGSGTGGAVYLVSGTCPAWNFPANWTSQAGAYPILSAFTTWDVWQGPSGGLWSNGANWSSGVPTSTTNVLFNTTDNNNSTIDSSFAGTIANLSINGYTGTITQGNSLTITGAYVQTSGTFTCTTPATYTFSASEGFSIPTASGTLRFNRFTGGGTSGSPYAIYDVYGLQAMEEELGDFFILANNIDASATASWNSGSGFTPVSSSPFPAFSGNLNGEGYTISHLNINLHSITYVGLFGYAALSSNSISNLNLTVDNITSSSGQYIGGLVGFISSGTITTTSVTVNAGKTISGSSQVGGVVGENGGATISKTYATISGTVSGASYIGGFVGYETSGSISNSYVTMPGTVSGTGSFIGGFVGYDNSSGVTISDSYTTGTVSGTGTDVGGFVGYNGSSNISNSYATVNVTGSSNVNGFVGLNSSGVYNNDWYYNGTTYTQPANVTQATGYSDFYATGSGTGGAVYLVSGTCPAWNFPANWTSQAGAYPILSAFTTWDVWQGPSGGLWSNGANWSSGVPTSTTNVLFNTTDNNNSTIDASFAGTIANLSINGYTGTITQSHNFTITGAYVQTSGTFTCTTPATYTFTATEGFLIPSTSGTLYFNRFTGSGTSGSPYAIYDVYGLQAMEEELGDFFILANNIDASATANWNSGSGFTPVSSSPFPAFSGNFNGEGYTISHLNIILTSTNYVGLFGYAALSSNSISNLNLTVDNITSSSGQYIGGLVGFISSGTITATSVTVNASKTISGNSYMGGVIGENAGATITNTFATISGTVSGSNYTGGFVGYETSGNISNSYVTIPGTVSGTGSFIGGFVGYDNSSGVTISDSYTTGTVSGTGTDVGGFVGYNSSSNISNSYATVSVTGSSNVNGFVGLDSSGVYNNDWYYNGTTYTQPANVTQATGYSDFYATGSGTGGAVYLVSGTCPAWNFPANWTSQAGAYPILSAFTTWDVWQGPSGGLWSNGANWSSGVPTSTTNVLFNTTDNNNSTIDSSFAGTIANLSINGYTGTITQGNSLTITGAYVQTSGTFTCTTPATYTFSASEGFSIPSTSGTLYFNRFTGSGTSGSPYAIYDVYGLQAMEEELSDSFALAENINASVTVNWGSGSGFTPVSNSPFPSFSGNLNGKGFTISHLDINLHSTNYVGLFGYAALGSNSISNLNLTVDNITSSSGQYTGGLVGFISSGTITATSVTVNASKTISGNSYIGGVIGENAGATVTNTFATISGTVSGASYVGGIVGYNASGNISNSYVTIPGTVSGTGSYIGGFVGYDNSGTTISDTYATGTVSGTGTDVGGFAGYNISGTISNSYATVGVAGSSTVNGFVGLNSSGTYNNDWYYNGSAYTQPANVTEASGYSDFYGTGSGTGGAVYLVSGTCPAWNFSTNWQSQLGAYPILRTQLANQNFFAFF